MVGRPADRVTIEDVAVHAGVSKATVSKALNGRSDIAPDTRQRVLAAVEEVGERHAVRSLLRRRRVAYGAGVAAATVAGVIGAVVINSRSRRSPSLAG